MSINIDSEASCRKAYLNYHCYNNSMGISTDEMAEITTRWADELPSWQRSVDSDETEYDFDDSEFEELKNDGRAAAEEKTEYNGKQTGQYVRTVGDSVGTAASAVCGGVAVFSGEAICKIFGGIAGCLIGFGVGTAAIAKKANKEQVEACNTLQDVMTDNQGALTDAQSDMATMSGELTDLTDEANEANEDANEDIEKKKTEYDMYKASFEELKDKIDAGESLKESEKELYKTSIKNLNATGEDITTIQEDASDTVGEIYSDMEIYQDGYDYAAETMGEVQGSTDYAASFDSETKNMCTAEGIVQTLNAISSGASATEVSIMAAAQPFWYAVALFGIAALGALGAGFSTTMSIKQFKWAGEVGDEIGMREDTQDLNDTTMGMYDEEIDTYDSFMQDVEELEVEIPDEVEPAENAPDPNTNSNPFVPTGTPEPLNPTTVKKKEDEKE